MIARGCTRWTLTFAALAASCLGVSTLADAGVRSRTARSSDEAQLPAVWLGIWMGDAVDGGVEVVAVVPGGPAEGADLRVGDVIIEANQQAVTAQHALRHALLPLEAGDMLEVLLLRDGDRVRKQIQVAVRQQQRGARIGRRPLEIGAGPKLAPTYRVARAGLGLRVEEMTPELRRHYGAPEDAGVLVVKADSPVLAGEAGIRVGDVVVRVGERTIEDSGQLYRELARWRLNRPLEAEVVRQRERLVLRVSDDRAILDAARSDRERKDRELVKRKLELEIERLERRLEQLRRELQEHQD